MEAVDQMLFLEHHEVAADRGGRYIEPDGCGIDVNLFFCLQKFQQLLLPAEDYTFTILHNISLSIHGDTCCFHVLELAVKISISHTICSHEYYTKLVDRNQALNSHKMNVKYITFVTFCLFYEKELEMSIKLCYDKRVDRK